MTIPLLSALVFLFLNVFFVLAEFALVRANPSRIEVMQARGVGRAGLVLKMLQNLDSYLSALQIEGRMATVGYVDGVVTAQIDILALHKKRLTLYGVSNKLRSMAQRIEATQRFAQDVMPYFAQGTIAPLIDRVFPFDELPAAFARLAEGPMGKLLLKVN